MARFIEWGIISILLLLLPGTKAGWKRENVIRIGTTLSPDFQIITSQRLYTYNINYCYRTVIVSITCFDYFYFSLFPASMHCPYAHPYPFSRGFKCCSSLMDELDPERLLDLYDSDEHCSSENSASCSTRDPEKTCTVTKPGTLHYCRDQWFKPPYLMYIK